MKLAPKNGNLIVKEPDREMVTKSGIFLPEVANARDDEQVAQGEILASDNADYKKGDWVLFHKVLPVDAVVEMNDKKIKVWFLKTKDVLAKIE